MLRIRVFLAKVIELFSFGFVVPFILYFGNLWPMSAFKQILTSNMRQPGNSVMEQWIFKKLLETVNVVDETLAVNKCDIKPTDAVLEVGFGPGLGIQQASALVKKSEGGRVYGVDFSRSMVEVASSRLSEEISDGVVELRHGSVGEMPFDDNTFDKIFHCNVFYFWDDCLSCCRELLRVLKSAALMVTVLKIDAVAKSAKAGLIKSDNSDVYKYMTSLRQAGFVNVEMKTENIAGEKYGCVYAWKDAK